MPERVVITPAAAALVERLIEQHGELIFHQSGGCCDGSAPMCFPAGDFKTGACDIHLGTIAGCRFFISESVFAYYAHSQLIIDVVEGRGASFSVEAPEGLRFLTRSRLFTDEESAQLEAPARA